MEYIMKPSDAQNESICTVYGTGPIISLYGINPCPDECQGLGHCPRKA
jgi:hypothetical protein